MVAIPLLFGRLTAADYEDEVAADPRVDALRAKGYEVEVVVGDEGHVNGILRIPGTPFFEAGADPRGDTYAIAW